MHQPRFSQPWRITGAVIWLLAALGCTAFLATKAITYPDGGIGLVLLIVGTALLGLGVVEAVRNLSLVARGRLSVKQIADLSQTDSLFIRGHAIHRRARRMARRAPSEAEHLVPRLREERRILREALEQGLANPTAVAIRSVERAMAPIQEQLGEVWQVECVGCGAAGSHPFRHEAAELATAEHDRRRESGANCAEQPQLKPVYLGKHPDEQLPPCRESGCSNRAFVNELCQVHYEQDRRLASWRPSTLATDRLEGPRVDGGDPSVRVGHVKEQIGRLRSDIVWVIEHPAFFDPAAPTSARLFTALGQWDDRRASMPRSEAVRLAGTIETLFEEARARAETAGLGHLHGASRRKARQVSKLVRKAKSTTSPAERDQLMGKANELLAGIIETIAPAETIRALESRTAPRQIGPDEQG